MEQQNSAALHCKAVGCIKDALPDKPFCTECVLKLETAAQAIRDQAKAREEQVTYRPLTPGQFWASLHPLQKNFIIDTGHGLISGIIVAVGAYYLRSGLVSVGAFIYSNFKKITKSKTSVAEPDIEKGTVTENLEDQD